MTCFRQSKMLHTGFLLGIILSLWGVIMDSASIPPQVTNYQTVTPQRLKDPSLSYATTHQTYPDEVWYLLTISGHNYTLHLERNKDLFGKNFSVTHHTEQGDQVTTFPDLGAHCYYHGHIVGVEDSSTSMGLCSGLKGFVVLQNQMYLIEPLTGPESGQRDDRHSSETYKGEGLHALYNYKHLRRKNSFCAHGNTTTDHDAPPPGLLQISRPKVAALTKRHSVKPRTVELVLVVDHEEFKMFDSKKTVENRMLEIANHVDKLYHPLGIRVMLVGVDIWSDKDQIEVSTDSKLTLERFLEWRQRSLLPRIMHDNAQFITGVDFHGHGAGLATIRTMCTSRSGAINKDYNNNTITVATTIAHEMGHNLGMSHDAFKCLCGTVLSKTDCIMADTIGLVFPTGFSWCSRQDLKQFLEEVNPTCLLDTPSTLRIHGGAVCGNSFLELGEECDCGTVEECKNSCCNSSTCKLNTGAQCAHGECCLDCQLKPAGSLCRPETGECDLAENCTGFSASCPTDAYIQNGLACSHEKGYCFNGQCPSRHDHCRRLWGPEAQLGSSACFNAMCKKTQFSLKCPSSDEYCGALYCSGGREFPVTSRKTSFKIANVEICNSVLVDPADMFPSDLGMVPTGTKCGNNKVCYNQQCQEIRNLKEYTTMYETNCSAKCNNHGVCDDQGECRCDPGWAPPFCKLPEGISMFVAVAVLPLVILVVGIFTFCFQKRRRRVKRGLQSNQEFRSQGTQNRPPLQNTPRLVKSQGPQLCKPMFTVNVRLHIRSLSPSRADPEVVSVQPRPASSMPNYTEITERKPPLPPEKPSSLPPHTQLPAEGAALMPPSWP